MPLGTSGLRCRRTLTNHERSRCPPGSDRRNRPGTHAPGDRANPGHCGRALAFDVRGLATKVQRNNSEFTPWGRKLRTSQRPNPAKIVGWCFFIVGAAMLVENLVAGIIYLVRRT